MRPLKGVRGMRGMGVMRRATLRELKPLEPGLPPSSEDRLEKSYDGWVDRVGESRAQEARRMFERRPTHLQAANRATLPNLLAEAWAEKTGHRYLIEHDMGWAQPDLVVFLPAGPVVIRVQGDYWHSIPDTVAKDEMQRAMLEGNTIEGKRILRVVDAWEHEIYESEAVLDRALEAGTDG
jgi:hypothetical protein